MAEQKTPGTGTSPAQSKPSSEGNRSRSYAEIRAARDAKQTAGGARKNGPASGKKKESWIRSLIYAGIIALIIRTFFFEAFRIPTGSMKNTLLVGDYLFVNKIGYFIETPKYIPLTNIEIPHLHIPTWSVHRGDVVVFEYPGDQDVVTPTEKNVNYIKRCIGLPGDVIQVINKQVYVNGKIYPNPPGAILQPDTERVGTVDPSIFPHGAQWNKDNYGPIRVPKKGMIIPVNKDNIDKWQVFIEREGHKVEIGMDDQVLIDGKPATQYQVQRDYLWMMGDNRDNSEDSRFWGFAPMDNVVGSGFVVYWSWYNPPSSGMGDGYDAIPGKEGPNEPQEPQSFHIRWGRIAHLIH
ncbi:MAG TPA: signal peptidase I [Candidatus Kapabacteria bacterium]|nr:signal peptidase I [Candidatus Kapabacteria bacterium]